jgi:acetoin utilization deacetylase AcuC-like enzyme
VLQQILHANGAFVQAAERARDVGLAFAPVSGFHHAGWDHCGGFCTFNGLMVAAVKLLQRDDTKKVLILDFDGHHGDGTEDIIEELKLRDSVTHLTRHRGFDHSPEAAVKRALQAIDECPDIVLLQAGADSYVGDPFGAGYFGREQWIARDRRIFERCKALSVPVVWNLAGGYDGGKTVMLHYETWRTAIDVYCPHKIPAHLA